jgi:hypothetical protein
MTHNCRMGWLPNAQMIADGMPAAAKAKPPALMRRPATEFKGECFDARDMAHPAAKAVSAPVTQTITTEVNAGTNVYREAIEAAAESCAAQEPSPPEREWIEFDGGIQPVAAGTRVEVRCRNGEAFRFNKPEVIAWATGAFPLPYDIVAYRVLP